MAEAERLAALNQCLETCRSALAGVNAGLAGAGGGDGRALLEQRQVLGRKIEQIEIEIGFIEDVDGLIRRYTDRQRAALDAARSEPDSGRKRAFEDRAAFCEVVVDEALERKQTVRPIPPGALNQILAELKRAAQEAQATVASANRAIEIVNRTLDGLIVLAKVAAKLAV